jgi:hypothetical protein
LDRETVSTAARLMMMLLALPMTPWRCNLVCHHLIHVFMCLYIFPLLYC